MADVTSGPGVAAVESPRRLDDRAQAAPLPHGSQARVKVAGQQEISLRPYPGGHDQLQGHRELSNQCAPVEEADRQSVRQLVSTTKTGVRSLLRAITAKPADPAAQSLSGRQTEPEDSELYPRTDSQDTLSELFR